MPMLDCAAQLPTLTPLAILMGLAAEPWNSLVAKINPPFEFPIERRIYFEYHFGDCPEYQCFL